MEEVKVTWYNELRYRLSRQIAKLYQISSPVLWVPIIGNIVMDFLWHFSDWVSPFETPEGCLNPVMLEVIRERMGISQEEFNSKLQEIREEDERKELGLPPKNRK